MVSSVERLPTSPVGSQLILHCKDFRVFQILVPQERDCVDVHASLVRLSRPEKYSELYCLSFNPSVNKEEREESWNFIDLLSDYKRMGVPNNLWVMTAANSEYRVCDSYPSELFVPKSATPTIIVGSSRFRSRGRFPALSYFHQDTLAAVCRCSQPLSGFSGRCQEDEMMLQAVMKSNPGSDYIYVVDTRPKLNAMANRAAGKGYENEDHYTNIKLQFIGIENIHVMRSSQQKIIDMGEMRSPSMTDFLWGLENSGWLKHIKAVLDAGVFIARAVADEGVSVLVHCSDGWDRTAQACSVASILLDPYYRTIKGLMFLECVWQLSEQFPCAFEFNERFLIAVHTHVYSCQLRERTHSVWPHLWKDRANYTNPLYKAELSQSQGILRPNTTPYCFKMWKGLYNHMEKSMPPSQSPVDFLSAVREESQQLEEELTNHQEVPPGGTAHHHPGSRQGIQHTKTHHHHLRTTSVQPNMCQDQHQSSPTCVQISRIAVLTGQPITWEKIEVPRRRRTTHLPQRHCGPDPPTIYTDPITSSAQDTGQAANQKAQTKNPTLNLQIEPQSQLKSHDLEDLSTCSDLESGVADLSSRSSSSGDYTKDPDLE
ncbi:hypothetical protein INR49_002099 [Caranx melampygus]|nr:hypothetical protein INR49_002099 [Caranx melampygus]